MTELDTGSSPSLAVDAIYSRSLPWLAPGGEVRFGHCYVLRLRRFTWQRGVGETVAEALADLERALRYWVESFDDCEPPDGYEGEPAVIGELREAIVRGDLLEQLRSGLREPVLDPDDEPRRANAAR